MLLLYQINFTHILYIQRIERIAAVLFIKCHQIGQILDIKLATVKTHVSHILQKLGVKRRSEAKTVAQQRGLSPGNGI